MTGAYLRVRRDGSMQNILVEDLTDEEREHIFSDKPTGELVRWINLLSNTIVKEKQCQK